MAARKLQQEIDREFKKCDEGMELFNSIHDKLLSSQNASQKDKLESALKKEIKKLQRSRDMIKSWATLNDVKDKKPLMEKRRAIETVCTAHPPCARSCDPELISFHSAWRSSKPSRKR